MNNFFSLAPHGARAREMMGETAFAQAVEARRQQVDAVLNSPVVQERWNGETCCETITNTCRFQGDVGLGDNHWGVLVSEDGEMADMCVASWLLTRSPSKLDPSCVDIVRTWFWVSYGESLCSAFDRAESKLLGALPENVTHLPSRMRVELEARITVMWLRIRGRLFWWDGQKDCALAMFYDLDHNFGGGRRGGYLMRIQSDDFRTWLASHAPSKSALMRRDNPVMANVQMASLNPEVSTGVRPGNLWDRRGDVIYISCGDSMMVKVTAGACELVPNGTDDVVFMAGQTLKEWTLLGEDEAVDPIAGTQLFSSATYQSEHGAMIVRMWFLSLFACLRAKPALVFTGRFRSGKSRAAEGISEILGVKHRCAAIQEKGEEDFWVSVDAGGIVCFDNVDSKNSWFGDAMQLACTKGSREKRKLYGDTLRTFEANAAQMLTSNNALFASESGLTDRCQICRLQAREATTAGGASDSGLSADIAAKRDACLTWAARTIARALADHEPVASNVNMRHPDYADFVLRCARARGMYDSAVAALKSAEFDKALFTIQNDRIANYVFEIILADLPGTFRPPSSMPPGCWNGGAAEMMRDIRGMFGVDDSDRAVSTRTIGKVMNKYFDQLAMCFEAERPRTLHGKTVYRFTGLSAPFSRIIAANGDAAPEQAEQEPPAPQDEGLEF